MWCALLLSIAAQEPVTFRSLLEELADPASLARWPSRDYRLHVSSGRCPPAAPDAAPEARTGHATSGVVLFETSGPGAIVGVRIPDGTGKLRYFVDGAEAPSLETDRGISAVAPQNDPRTMTLEDVATADGRIVVVPVPFARSIRLVGSLDAGGESTVVWREYAAGTVVESLPPWTNEALWPPLDGATKPLDLGTSDGVATFAYTLSEPNPEGFLEALDPKLARGPRAVDEIEFVVEAPDVDSAVDRLWMELCFDGEVTVAVPFGAFFASRPGVQPSRTRFTEVMLGARGHPTARPAGDSTAAAPRDVATFRSRWTMPYRERFELRIVNQGPPQTHVSATVRTIPWTWDERTLRFHASWRRTDPLERERTLVELRGRALVVGDARFGAGKPGTAWRVVDEWAAVTDDGPPWKTRIVGGCLSYVTGSRTSGSLPWTPRTDLLEPDERTSSVFAVSTRRSSSHVLARWAGLDAAPAGDAFVRTIELDPPVELDALTVWYGGPDAKVENATTDRATRVRPYDLGGFARPGTLEAEALAVISSSPSVSHRRNRQPEIASGRWSGDVELRVVVRETTGSIDLDVPVATPGKREVIVYPSKGPDYGLVRFHVDGGVVERTFDGHASELTAPEPFSLGVFDLRTSMRLTLELLRPDDPAAPFRSVIGLDAVELR